MPEKEGRPIFPYLWRRVSLRRESALKNAFVCISRLLFFPPYIWCRPDNIQFLIALNYLDQFDGTGQENRWSPYINDFGKQGFIHHNVIYPDRKGVGLKIRCTIWPMLTSNPCKAIISLLLNFSMVPLLEFRPTTTEEHNNIKQTQGERINQTLHGWSTDETEFQIKKIPNPKPSLKTFLFSLSLSL